MQEMYKNLGFIIGFMVCVVAFQTFLGENATEYMLLLVLLGMVLFNVDAMKAKLESLV